MLQTRKAYIMKAETVGDEATVNKPINIKHAISAILLTYQATTGATSNQGVYPHDEVDTIQVADGSDVLFNLTGVQAQIQNYLESGKLPLIELDEGASATMRESFYIRFGRYIGDPFYWLNPKLFDNLMLNLEHVLTISATAGFATTTGRVTAQAIVFKDMPSTYEGFLTTKSQHTWTSAASGEEPINLPVDHPWRMAALRAFETAIAFDTTITNVEISADGDGYIPVNVTALDLVRENVEVLPKVQVDIQAFRTDADTMSCLLAYPKAAHANARLDLDVAGIDAVTADQLTLQLLSLTAAPAIAKSATDTAIFVSASGWGYLNGFGIFFGHKDDPLTWWDVRKHKSIVGKITQGNAGAACSFWVQQVRK